MAGLAPAAAIGAEPEVVRLPSIDWQVGERFRLETVSTDGRHKKGRVLESFGVQALSEVEVVSRDAEGYVLRMRDLRHMIFGKPPLPVPVMERLLAIGKRVPIELEMDRHGRVAGLANREAVVGAMQRIIDEIIGHITETMPTEAAALAERAIRPLAQPAHIEQRALLVPSLFYSFAGSAMERHALYQTDSQIDLPFSEVPIAATTTYEVTTVALDRRVVTYGWHQRPDEAALAEEAKKYLQRLITKQKQEGQALPSFAAADFAVDYSAELDYSLDSGRPIEMNYVHIVTVAGVERVRRYRVRLTPE
jgi:hypothetical protein